MYSQFMMHGQKNIKFLKCVYVIQQCWLPHTKFLPT